MWGNMENRFGKLTLYNLFGGLEGQGPLQWATIKSKMTKGIKNPLSGYLFARFVSFFCLFLLSVFLNRLWFTRMWPPSKGGHIVIDLEGNESWGYYCVFVCGCLFICVFYPRNRLMTLAKGVSCVKILTFFLLFESFLCLETLIKSCFNYWYNSVKDWQFPKRY